MYDALKRYGILYIPITAIIVCVFLVNNITWAQAPADSLATLPAGRNPIAKREITAAMYRAERLIWLAHSPRYLDLLDRYDALALLLPSGRYLMTPETADNDLTLIRSVTHEDNEILMQQEQKLHPTRYSRLMKQVFGRDDIMKLYYAISHYKEPNKKPDNVIFNDLISKAFEILFITDEGLVYPDELTSQEREFIALMRPILEAKDSMSRYKNFSQVFFDTDKRTKAIQSLQEDKNERFYRVASSDELHGHHAHSDTQAQQFTAIPSVGAGRQEEFANRLWDWATLSREEQLSSSSRPIWGDDDALLGKNGVTYTPGVYACMFDQINKMFPPAKTLEESLRMQAAWQALQIRWHTISLEAALALAEIGSQDSPELRYIKAFISGTTLPDEPEELYSYLQKIDQSFVRMRDALKSHNKQHRNPDNWVHRNFLHPDWLRNLVKKIASEQSPIKIPKSIDRQSYGAKQTTQPSIASVQQVFDALNTEARKENRISASVSKLRGTSQNLMEVSKFRLCLPIEILRNSPDIALALNSTGLLKQRPKDVENIEFELVLTGVMNEDIKLIEGLNKDDIKKALNLPSKFTISMITEEQIQQTAKRIGYDATNPKQRVEIVKDFFSGTLAKDEHMAIATDAIDTTAEADILKSGLKKELESELAEENISILVLVKAENGKSMYSLSKILNDWLEAINHGNHSAINRILPLSAPLTPELERAINMAWTVLIAA